MKINAKMHYGLKTMIELAMNGGDTGMLQKELAVNQCMPNKFLDSVIHSLKVTGLIINVGGRKSGYKLARPAAEISVYDVYRAFEPELRIHFCLAGYESCPRTQSCASRLFLCEFNEKMEAYMRSNTIEELAAREMQLSIPTPAQS
jgi:Rrf2 family protein